MSFRRAAVASFGPVLLHASVVSAAVIVPGSANPNLAGRDLAYTCCGGDSVPAQSPPEVEEVEIEECALLTFSVSGKVSLAPGTPMGNNPDGDGALQMTNFGDGISAPLNVRTNALFGVFLGDDSPTGMPTPGQLDFSAGLNFSSLNSGIGQIFFIGDGLTSDTNAGMFEGLPQGFFVPAGATRLFLGTSDGYGWYNNSGSFTVEATSIPEPRDRECGDPNDPVGVFSSDALSVLRAAVGSALCQLCVCDVDRSTTIVSSDALAVLRHAVGQDVPLACDCCPQLE